MEELSCLLKKAREEGYILGFKVTRKGGGGWGYLIFYSLMTHLFFAKLVMSKCYILVGSSCGLKPFQV